jgi:hypothetical protein
VDPAEFRIRQASTAASAQPVVASACSCVDRAHPSASPDGSVCAADSGSAREQAPANAGTGAIPHRPLVSLMRLPSLCRRRCRRCPT